MFSLKKLKESAKGFKDKAKGMGGKLGVFTLSLALSIVGSMGLTATHQSNGGGGVVNTVISAVVPSAYAAEPTNYFASGTGATVAKPIIDGVGDSSLDFVLDGIYTTIMWVIGFVQANFIWFILLFFLYKFKGVIWGFFLRLLGRG